VLPSASTALHSRRGRRWLLAGAAVAVLLLLGGLGVLLASAYLGSTFDFGGKGLEESVGEALERGEREGERVVVELTAEEVGELITEGVADAGVTVSELSVEVAAADRPDRGHLWVSGRLGDGKGSFEGRASVELAGDQLRLEMEEFDVQGYRLPGVAESLAADMISDATTVDAELDRRGLRLVDVAFGHDLVRLVAVETDTKPAARPAQPGENAPSADEPEGEAGASEPLVPPGEAHRPVTAGEPVVLVLGDSVAAGVGVDDFAESYASRVHGWLQRRDEADYGLADLARPGETSRSLRQEGQLDNGLARLAEREPALIVLDIGANDLLAALRHPACADDITTTACHALVSGRLDDYREAFAATVADLREVAPRAPLVVMTTYNPFSFGTDSAFEERGNEVVAKLNRIAARITRRHGGQVADGATPFEGRATELTHMGDDEPDIHPNAAGYDALAAALTERLEHPAPSLRPGVR
jgi:lysophospholipase L1-like esterase